MLRVSSPRFLGCITTVNLLGVSYSSVLGHYKLSKALIYCWRNCQPDVSGCPALHGSGDVPEHVVVCTAPDLPGVVFPLAGTGIVTFLHKCSKWCTNLFFLILFLTCLLCCLALLWYLVLLYKVNSFLNDFVHLAGEMMHLKQKISLMFLLSLVCFGGLCWGLITAFPIVDTNESLREMAKKQKNKKRKYESYTKIMLCHVKKSAWNKSINLNWNKPFLQWNFLFIPCSVLTLAFTLKMFPCN